jgi:hypothetical protein
VLARWDAGEEAVAALVAVEGKDADDGDEALERTAVGSLDVNGPAGGAVLHGDVHLLRLTLEVLEAGAEA